MQHSVAQYYVTPNNLHHFIHKRITYSGATSGMAACLGVVRKKSTMASTRRPLSTRARSTSSSWLRSSASTQTKPFAECRARTSLFSRFYGTPLHLRAWSGCSTTSECGIAWLLVAWRCFHQARRPMSRCMPKSTTGFGRRSSCTRRRSQSSLSSSQSGSSSLTTQHCTSRHADKCRQAQCSLVRVSANCGLRRLGRHGALPSRRCAVS